MASPLPYEIRLRKLIGDVSEGGMILDLNWKGAGLALPSSKSLCSLDLSRTQDEANVLPALKDERLSLVIVRAVWPKVLASGLIAHVNLRVDQEIPLVVIEEVADAFSDYRGLSPRFETQSFEVGRSLVFSSEIEAGLRENGFTPQNMENFRVNVEYPLDEWIAKASTTGAGHEPAKRQTIKRLPKFLLDEIGVRRTQSSIVYPHIWSISSSFKSDLARHRVPAVASALVSRTDKKNGYELLIQKRHREKAFWESWELPQGHIVPGESFQEAAVRELKEETGLDAKLSAIQPFIHEWHDENAYSAACVYTRIDQTPKKEFFSVGVTFDYVAGEPKAPEDRQFTWATLDQLKQMLQRGEIFPLNEEMVRRFVNLHLGVWAV